jgi:hypothetical protein
MRKKYLSAAMVAAGFLALPIGVAHADEVSDLKAEAKALQKQNDALAKRLAAIEKRQKVIEADTTATQRVMNAHAADMPLPPPRRPTMRCAGRASASTASSMPALAGSRMVNRSTAPSPPGRSIW